MKNILRSAVLSLILNLVFISANFSQTYCVPTFSSGCTFSNYISSVSVGGMTNTASGCTQSNYLTKVASITAGDTIQMIVTVAGWDGINVFTDLNNDGDMTDTLENLYRKYNATTPPTTYTFDITVPSTAQPGNHRFRVVCGNGGSASNGTDPCVNIAYGNYHDYTLKITNNCPADTNMSVFNFTDTSADFSWGARQGVSGYEYKVDTSALQPAGTGTFTADTTAHVGGLVRGETYHFWLRTSCGSGVYSAWEKITFLACLRPDAVISPSGELVLCKSDTTVLSIVGFDTSITYQWYRNTSKLVGKTSADLEVFNFTGRYYFYAESIPGCKSKSPETYVNVVNNPTDTAVLSLQGHLLITDGFSTYKWLLNGNTISGATDSTHLATANGTYIVYGYDTNGCTAGYSNSVTIKTVGVNQFVDESGIAVYPNPVINHMEIHNQSGSADFIFELVNTQGATVYTGALKAADKVLVDVSSFPPGLYILRLNDGRLSYFKRIIIE